MSVLCKLSHVLRTVAITVVSCLTVASVTCDTICFWPEAFHNEIKKKNNTTAQVSDLLMCLCAMLEVHLVKKEHNTPFLQVMYAAFSWTNRGMCTCYSHDDKVDGVSFVSI